MSMSLPRFVYTVWKPTSSLRCSVAYLSYIWMLRCFVSGLKQERSHFTCAFLKWTTALTFHELYLISWYIDGRSAAVCCPRDVIDHFQKWNGIWLAEMYYKSCINFYEIMSNKVISTVTVDGGVWLGAKPSAGSRDSYRVPRIHATGI